MTQEVFKMDKYLNSWELIFFSFNSVFFPWFVSILIITVILFIPYKLLSDNGEYQHMFFLLGFSYLGGMLGITTGSSETPVLGTLLPALLTFITGLLAYLFNHKNSAEYKPLIPMSMLCLMVCSVFSVFLGTTIRSQIISSDRDYEIWLLKEKSKLELNELLNKKKANLLECENNIDD